MDTNIGQVFRLLNLYSTKNGSSSYIYYSGTMRSSKGYIWRNFEVIKYIENSTPDAKNLGQQCTTAGNPITIGTGNKFQVETDYTSRTALQFKRFYNSSPNVMPAISARIGFRWRHTYARSIAPPALEEDIPEGITSPSTTTLGVYRPDGQQLAFNLTNGVWQSDADINDTIEPIEDANGITTGWRYTHNDDVEIYDTEGKLLSIQS